VIRPDPQASGARVEHHTRVSSTNDLARQRGLAGAADGITIVADAQTAGRGRRGRHWRSAPGVNLYLSQVVRTNPAQAGLIPLVGALAARETIATELGPGFDVVLKWPNDLLVDGSKLAGILVEWIDTDPPFGILGIGINVNAARADLPVSPRWPASSLGLLTGHDHDRQALLARMLAALQRWRDILEICPGRLVQALRVHCVSLGRGVRVHMPGQKDFEGTAVRVDPDGVLVVQTGGAERRVVAGDVDLL